MRCKNIDVLAILLLLGGAAALSHIRSSAVLQDHSSRLVEFTNRQMQPLLPLLHLPRLCLTRD